jgi:hypothetical protein
MTTNVEKLKSLGYEIEVAVEGYEAEGIEQPTVFSVSGFGIQSLHVEETDTDTWKRLANKKAHDSRVLQKEEGVSAREKLESDVAAQVALGDISQEEAKETLDRVAVVPQTPVEILADAIGKLPDGPLTKDDLLSVLEA